MLEDRKWSWIVWDFHPSTGPTLITGWDCSPTPDFGVFVEPALAGTRPRIHRRLRHRPTILRHRPRPGGSASQVTRLPVASPPPAQASHRSSAPTRKLAKTLLVSGLIPAKVVLVDKTFFRRWFGRPPETAAETVKSRADHGDAEAQFQLGLLCANGGAEAQDFAAAASWYLKAAQQQLPVAEFNLGLLYAHGQGVPRDDVQAFEWIQKAARHGNPDAQFNLGMRHYRMAIESRLKDGSESRIEAYKWLRLAAAQGYSGSEAACQCVALTMTRAEVTDGLQRQAGFTAQSSNSLQAP